MLGNFIATEHSRYGLSFYVESFGVSSAEYCVHLVGVNRLSDVESFFGCIVGNMAQDVGMV